jgi:hypothetical protein
MKNIKFITGIWNGIYTYDSEEFNGESIRFTMSLTLENGEIIGQCYDSLDDGGIPLLTTIRGFIEGKNIRLVKQYPFLIYIDETGEYRKKETTPQTEAHYLGEIESGMVKGIWELKLGSYDQSDKIDIKHVTGKWEMKKQILIWA